MLLTAASLRDYNDLGEHVDWEVIRMGRCIDTYIDIDAPPQRVWQVLIDLPAWREWNPFIPSITGKLETGARLQITVSPPGIKSMEFNPKVFAVRPCKEIIWGGSFLLFVYRGDHAILLEPLPSGGTRFRQCERFRGPVVLFMGRMFKPTEQGYHQMNRALKGRVEDNPGSWKGTTCTCSQ